MFVPIGTEESAERRRFPLITVTLVTINGLVFLLELFILLTAGEQGLHTFITSFGVVPASITEGERLYTLLTTMFVHGSISHVGFNMIYLLAFGDNVEDHMGRWRYLIFYVVAGLLASIAQIAVDPASQIPSVGASGAIAGILAAYIVLFPKGIVRMFLFLGPLTRIKRVPALLYIGIWFIIQFFNGLGSLGVATAETGGVAYWAHIGGFVAGFGLAYLYQQLISDRVLAAELGVSTAAQGNEG
jgi:membrane associated rhomboid family serine protease